MDSEYSENFEDIKAQAKSERDESQKRLEYLGSFFKGADITHWSNVVYDKNKEIERLEHENKEIYESLKDKHGALIRLERQNKIMREALEYYAQKDLRFKERGVIIEEFKPGSVARQALREVSGE